MFESLFVAAVLGAGGPPAPPPTPAVSPAPRAVPVVTAGYHLRNVAVGDVAEAVRRELGPDRVVGVRAAENQLVIRGSAATHARMVALIGELDRDVPQVVVQAMIAEVPVAFLADCGLTTPGAPPGAGCYSLNARERDLFALAFRNYPGRVVLSRPQMQVADNQTGRVAIGQDFPVVAAPAAGAAIAAGAAETRFVGVTVAVTPRIMPDGKVMLRVEPQTCSPVAPPVVLRAGATAFPFNISTVQTTVLVPDGDTVVIAQEKTGADGKPVALLVVLTPNVVRTER